MYPNKQDIGRNRLIVTDILFTKPFIGNPSAPKFAKKNRKLTHMIKIHGKISRFQIAHAIPAPEITRMYIPEAEVKSDQEKSEKTFILSTFPQTKLGLNKVEIELGHHG